jgi:cyclohexanone monooxygenase
VNAAVLRTSPDARADGLEVLVVGAGFAGMYALHRLRQLGMRALCLEAGTDVGGTWFWNRYPGARCDVESMEYSYSFSSELEQEWNWSERYASQPEILRYANHVADRFGLREQIRFDTRVVAATFDDDTHTWTVTASDGAQFTARFVVLATGCLSLPRMPDIEGRDSFRGQLLHTGRWPGPVDFTGRRVGVIGTGSSGIQVIPQIAATAAHLHVFQRTPNFSLPAKNQPLAPDYVAQYKANYPSYRAKARETTAGIAGHPMPSKGAFDDTDEERSKVYQAAWARGHIGFTRSYTDLLTNAEANATAAEFVRERIRQTVRDPRVADLLTPKDHCIGTKRVCLDTGYYETYNRDNVTLVDLRSTPIECITPEGIRTTEALHTLDTIVFATGFDAVTGAALDIDIRGSGGRRLSEHWAAGPRTYLGLMTSGFPNLWIVTGPGSPSVLTNMIGAIEQHVDWISDCLAALRQRGLTRIEADAAREEAWGQHVNEVAHTTLFPRAASWYTGANIPGKPRVFLPYVGGLANYRRKCDEVAAQGYADFILAADPVLQGAPS